MKKITKVFIFFILIASAAIGQTPTYFNTSTAGGANIFPLGSTATTRKVQWCIPAGNLGSVPVNNNITVVYFQAGNTTTQTYPNLNIRMKTGTTAGLVGAGGLFETGMTTVYSGVNVTKSSTAGAWFSFTLTTPWLYDPTLPLLLEVEQNATSGTGQQVYQALAFSGAGNGRMWGDYAQPSYIGSGANLINFGIDVIPATPCTAPPSTNTAVGPTVAACPNSSALVMLASSYSLGGLTYQWQSSTTSSVGPFTAIAGATNAALSTPSLTVNSWFNVVVTCTNPGGGASYTTSAGQVSVSPVITSTAPYFESFEGIGVPNRLPNCSWSISNPATCTTYTSSNTLGRIPRTGTSFASFYYTPAGMDYFYTNGIYLTAGVTYSAALWYETEYYGYNNWTDLSILYGAAQTPTGLVSIASTNGPAVSNVYKSLSNTFHVPTTGLYYIAVRATATSGSAQYLSWDDLSITIPCSTVSANSPTISLSVNSTTICAGDLLNLTATGADTYTWNTGSNASAFSDSPAMTTTYNVVGTSTLTGCTNTVSQIIVVNPAPTMFVISDKATVCSGSPVSLHALGVVTCTWSNGSNNLIINPTPTVSTTYTVIGSGADGCTATLAQMISVNTLPNVTASSSSPNQMCIGETVALTAAGTAVSYQWTSNTSSLLWSGTTIYPTPTATSIFTVTGTDANGCQNRTTIVQNVDACTGLKQNTASAGLRIYPNPTSGEFTVEHNSSLSKTIDVTDLSGRLIYTTVSSQQVIKLNIKDLANGIYYVKIKTTDSADIIKIVKQ
jgi:hypothetical protein